METLDRAGKIDQTAPDAASARDGRATVRVAYLLSRYPAISHTFFLHEVLGLRARHLHIETASINQPDRKFEDLPPTEAAEAVQTFYLKGGSKATAIREILATTITEPSVVLRGLRTILQLHGLTLRQRVFWLFYLAEAILVGRWMRTRMLTHLHVHFGGAVASVGLLTSAAWQIPYSLTIHGPEELLNTEAYQLREKTRRASFVICISDFCRSQLFQITPVAEWRKFHVVRLGVDPMLLTPPDWALRADRSSERRAIPRPIEIVCTGRLVAAKGHQILLEALRMLHAQRLSFRVTLIGDGPERAHLEQYVADHDLKDSITFTSALSHRETLSYVRRADIFTLASFAEGIPVALMEAMALGVPCVSTTIAGIPELIRTGIDGLLVPPADAHALADALRQLIVDSALRRTYGASARARIIGHYNLPLNQELLARVFERQLTPIVLPGGNLTRRSARHSNIKIYPSNTAAP